MEVLSANIAKPTFRRATLNGREHYVVPMTLIVPGVLAGSEGPLYYPIENIKKSTPLWNHVPLVVYHPQRDGKHVSARDAQVINDQGIGMVLSAHTNGKLTADGWFDVEKTRQVDPRVVEFIEAGRKIELSTGLFTKNKKAPLGANHNGRVYNAIADEYVPDHVAILPDMKGACSLEDGCGVFNEMSFDQIHGKLEEAIRTAARAGEPSTGTRSPVEGIAMWISEVFPDYVIMSKDGSYYKQGYTVADGEVSLSPVPPVKVERVVTYEPVSNEEEQSGPEKKKKGAGVPEPDAESKKKPLSNIVGDACCLTEGESESCQCGPKGPDTEGTAGMSSEAKRRMSNMCSGKKKYKRKKLVAHSKRVNRPIYPKGFSLTVNAFCPTGRGGGIDPTCGSGGGSGGGGGGKAAKKKSSGGGGKPWKDMKEGEWSGKASGKDLRDSFLRKAGAEGVSKTQHRGGLKLGGEKVKHGLARGKDSVYLTSDGKNLADAARTYAKKRKFKKVGSSVGVKRSSVYQDRHGNQIDIQPGRIGKTTWVVFTTGGKGIKSATHNATKMPLSKTVNAFCPTGPGGGIDPTCPGGGGGPSSGAVGSATLQGGDYERKAFKVARTAKTHREHSQAALFHERAAEQFETAAKGEHDKVRSRRLSGRAKTNRSRAAVHQGKADRIADRKRVGAGSVKGGGGGASKSDVRLIQSTAREMGIKQSLTDKDIARAHKSAMEAVKESGEQAEYYYRLKEFFSN